MSGKHIEIFLVDGEWGGITTADVSGWTGHVLSGPRSELKRILAREDAQRNGVYLLLGEDSSAPDNTRCYIGRTEDFSHRFLDHDKKKDWWGRCVLISSRDDSFNEGHWGYLEARLVTIAQEAQRSTLDDNKQQPKGRKLSEAQASDAEAFLAQVKTILPVLRIDVLRAGTHRAAIAEPEVQPELESSPIFRLELPKKNVRAQAQMIGGEFFVLAGSQVVAHWNGRAGTESVQRSYDNYRAYHARLVANGSIAIDSRGFGIVRRDIPFSSPSTAGAVVVGRSCNGRRSWTWEGGTYADWEERGL